MEESELDGLKTRFGIKIAAVLVGKISDFIVKLSAAELKIWCIM